MERLSIFREKEKDLKRRMRKSKIFEKDIKEKFVRSSGPGGQNVNKVSSCVVMVHVPTGLQVKCQATRTQAANRHKAKSLLVAKIERLYKQEEQKRLEEAAKKKRQTRKRPKVLKEKILQEKHKKSEKKASRKKIDIASLEDF